MESFQKPLEFSCGNRSAGCSRPARSMERRPLATGLASLRVFGNCAMWIARHGVAEADLINTGRVASGGLCRRPAKPRGVICTLGGLDRARTAYCERATAGGRLPPHSQLPSPGARVVYTQLRLLLLAPAFLFSPPHNDRIAGVMVRPTLLDLKVQLPATADGLEHPLVRSLMALRRYAARVRTKPAGRATAMVDGTRP